jgi:hypothetical protein
MTDANGTTGELGTAIRDLEDALRRASEAAARIKESLPQLERMSSVFGELESIIAAGRGNGSAASISSQTSAHVPASTATSEVPAVRVPRAPRTKQAPPSIIEQPASAIIEQLATAAIIEPPTAQADAPAPADTLVTADADESIETIAAIGAHGDKLISFRLEVDSQPGPLDLRAVDDAISGHDAVRDVALIDYDGKRATLKVWIAPPASPTEVQQALSARAGMIGSEGNHVSIVALEDVA